MGRQKRPKPTSKDIGPVVPLLFRFDLKPHSQERSRSKYYPETNKTFHYTPKKTRKYEDAINAQANAQHKVVEPFTADLAAIVNFRFPHKKHGDIDNLIKSIFDGMSPKYYQGELKRPGIIRHDKIIKKMTVEIFYEKGAAPCSEVILYRHESRAWVARLHVRIIQLWTRITDWFSVA